MSEDDQDPSDFRAAVVSVGMFGVLSEITLRVDRAFKLKERRAPQTLDYCLENLDSLVNGHQYVKFWVEFYNNFCVVYETDKTDEAISDRPGMIESFLTVSTIYAVAVCTPKYEVIVVSVCVHASTTLSLLLIACTKFSEFSD